MMSRKLLVVVSLMLAMSVWGLAAEPGPVTIMTQNMDAGTDMTYVVMGLMAGNIPWGVGLTYQEILASAIPQRVDMLAAKIAAKKPDLLVLQEATLWRTGDTPDTATNVLADQLQLLLSYLTAKHTPYDIAAVNVVNDIALAKLPSGAFRITDRNVLLVRADLRPPAFQLSDVHSDLFEAVYSIGSLQIPSGWISAMVHLGNRHFRLLATHLQGPIPGDPTAVAVQEAQAKQLLYEIRNSTVPVVIAGDFNSDALKGVDGPGPDNTDTAALIRAAGFSDSWAVAGSGPGPTWPFYLEDQLPPQPFVIQAFPYERIDLIFSQGLSVVAVEQVLAPAPNVMQWPYYASDHAGVLATLQF